MRGAIVSVQQLILVRAIFINCCTERTVHPPDDVFDSCVEEIAQKLVQGVVREAHAHDRSLPVTQHVPVGQQEPDNFRSHKRLRVVR